MGCSFYGKFYVNKIDDSENESNFKFCAMNSTNTIVVILV